MGDRIFMVIVPIIAAFVSGLGVALLNRGAVKRKHKREQERHELEQKQKQEELKIKQAQYELEQERKRAGIDKTFSDAVARLKDDSVGVRLDALYVLEQLGKEAERFQERIVRILEPFIREGIENRELHVPPVIGGSSRPNDDVVLAAEITSSFWIKTKKHFILLNDLQAENLDLCGISLQGARLWGAKLQDARLEVTGLLDTDLSNAEMQDTGLTGANLKGASLWNTNLQGAWFPEAILEDASLFGAKLQGANLTRARHLTVEQLLRAEIDEHTLLDKHLADDPRIQARIAELAEQTPAD